MNARKGLIGLFATIFLLSGIGMVMLVLDDRHDLSSRAGGWLSDVSRPALSGISVLPNETLWDGSLVQLPVVITYNNTVWLPPRDRNPVFYHLSSPATVRITTEKVDLPVLRKFLGEDFVFSRSLGETKPSNPDWIIESFLFKFFGTDKLVDVWVNMNGYSLISVIPDTSLRPDIEDFANSIILTNPDGQVKGAATLDESARLAALIRPSVVMILNNYCSQVTFANAPALPLSGKNYPFCLASAGSGFFVNQNGFIATNGHVVKNVPQSSLFYSVVSGALDDLLIDVLQVTVSQQVGSEVSRDLVAQKVKDAKANKESLYQFAALVDGLYTKNILRMDNGQNSYFVQLGNTPIQLSKSGVNLGKDIVTATFVDSDYQEPNPVTGFSSSDVALLKVEGNNFPALPLGKLDDVAVGSSVEVIGFPGVVMGTNSFLLDASANAEPTFTKGVISAFKQAKGDKKNLIQTDASINHGNSGGPAVSSDGNVIGIATYGLNPTEGSGNYNFLRDIADLKALMVKNNIPQESSPLFATWKNGLENFWLSYFKYAKNDFGNVVESYPAHPSAQKYLSESDTKINTPEDLTPRFTRNERRLYMSASGMVMIFSLVAISILGILDFLDGRKKINPPPSLPPQPVQTF